LGYARIIWCKIEITVYGFNASVSSPLIQFLWEPPKSPSAVLVMVSSKSMSKLMSGGLA